MANAVAEGYTDEDCGENEDWTGEEDWTGAVTDEYVDWYGPEWSDDWSWTDWNAWTDDWGNWSWTDSSRTVSGTPSTQESAVPTVGTGPRPTVQNQTAQSSGAASSAQHTVSSIPLDRPSTVQITDLESGVVTGGTGHQIRTGVPGPGLLEAFIGTVAVFSLSGNSQGIPISPVTLGDTGEH